MFLDFKYQIGKSLQAVLHGFAKQFALILITFGSSSRRCSNSSEIPDKCTGINENGRVFVTLQVVIGRANQKVLLISNLNVSKQLFKGNTLIDKNQP